MQIHDWKYLSVEPNSTIKETLAVMDAAALQIALVVSSDNQEFLGTVTDGDIRRGLLSDETLTSEVKEVMNSNPIVGIDGENEILWQKRLEKFEVQHLPIVEEGEYQKIIGLYSPKKRTKILANPIVLMLGGMGTRLRPLTEKVPKPMLPVGNQPILETIVRHIAQHGFGEFYFCINYLGEQIKQYFGDGSSLGVRIHYIQESERLGTAGALSLLPREPNLPFIVMNGDLLTKVDLSALLDFHQHHNNAVTVGVREYSQQVPYGVIEMEQQRVNQIVEKPIYRYFVNGGIYVLSPEVLQHVPDGKFYDMPELIDDVLAKQDLVGGFPITEYWMDIGQMPDYYQAQADYEVHFLKRT